MTFIYCYALSLYFIYLSARNEFNLLLTITVAGAGLIFNFSFSIFSILSVLKRRLDDRSRHAKCLPPPHIYY